MKIKPIKLKPAHKMKTAERRADILDNKLFSRSGVELSSFVAVQAPEYHVSERTIYRDIDYFEEAKAIYFDAAGLLYKVECSEAKLCDSEYKMSLALATALTVTKKNAKQMMPLVLFNSLVEEGVYKVAEGVLLKAKQRNPNQQEIRFEQAANSDSLYQLYANSEVQADVIEAIKSALYKDYELELQVIGYSELLYVKPEAILSLDGKQLLKIKQLSHPKTLKYLNVEEIVEAHTVDYWPLHSPAQMRRAA